MRNLFVTLLVILSINVLYGIYPYRYPQHRHKTTNSALNTILNRYNSNRWKSAVTAIDSLLKTENNCTEILFFNNLKAEILSENNHIKQAIATLQTTRLNSRCSEQNIEFIENRILEAKIQFLNKDYKKSINQLNSIDTLLTNIPNLKAIRALVYYDISQIHIKLMDKKSADKAISRGINILGTPQNNYQKAIRYFLLAERAGREQPFIKTENYRAATDLLNKSRYPSCYLNYLTLLKTVIQYANYEKNTEKALIASNNAQQFIDKYGYKGAKTYPLYIVTGETYRKAQQYKESELYFNMALRIATKSFGNTSYEVLLAHTYLGRLHRYSKNHTTAEENYNKALYIGKTGWKGDKFPNEFRLYGEMSKLYSNWNKPYKSLEFANKRLNYHNTDKTYNVNDIVPKHRKIKDISYYRTLLEKIQAYRFLYIKTQDDKYIKYGLNHCKEANNILNVINNKSVSEKAGLKNSARIKTIASYALWFNLNHYKKYNDQKSLKRALFQTDRTLSNYLKYQLRCRNSFPDKVTEQIKSDIRTLERKIDNSDNSKTIYRDSLLMLKNILIKNTFNRSARSHIVNSIDTWINNINPENILNNIDKNTGIFIIQDMYFIDERTDKIDNQKKNKYISVFYADNNTIKYHMIDSTIKVERDMTKALRAIKTVNSRNTNIHMRELSRQIIYPFADKIADKKNLVFIIGNTLSKIPFEAMYVNSKSDKQLISYNTSYNYSLALYIKKEPLTPGNNILAIAPQFGNNKTIADVRSYWINSSDTTNRGGGNSLASLPMAQEEIKQIESIYTSQQHFRYKTLTHNVSKSKILPLMSDYDIVHFATHGFVDKKNYKNSGLFLSPDNNDALLHLNEIYNLKLNTNLIVLSACKTNIGQNATGEGNMALPRAFKYAGAKNIIASLWNVNDKKSKEFMVKFYKNVINNKLTYAEALKQTKIECKKAGYNTIDWAGFVLIGK